MANAWLRAILLYCLLAVIDSAILRLPCALHADFNIYEGESSLVGFVIQTANNTDDPGCTVLCVRHPKCRSYNINFAERLCELNSKALADDETVLVSRPGWSYRSTDYNATLLGTTCEALKPCKPGILCRDTCKAPFFECLHCDKYHYGLHCDRRKDLDECASNPCLNRGQCVDLKADFRCNCAKGFAGKRCQTDINECNSYPCFNGGTCDNRVGSFDCKCPYGWSGPTCRQIAVDCNFHRNTAGRQRIHRNLLDIKGLTVGCDMSKMVVDRFLLYNTTSNLYYWSRCCNFFQRMKCRKRQAMTGLHDFGNGKITNLANVKVDCGHKNFLGNFTLLTSKDNAKFQYRYHCCDVIDQTTRNKMHCADHHSRATSIGTGNIGYLSRQYLYCWGRHAISAFELKITGQQMKYRIRCCRFTGDLA